MNLCIDWMLKYGDRGNNFEWFAKSTAHNYIRNDMVKFGVDRSSFGAWNNRLCRGLWVNQGVRVLVVIILE